MGWKLAQDPSAPAPPVVLDPTRCANCGHGPADHDTVVGCTVDGGSKYIEDDAGVGKYACSCEAFQPVSA